MSRFFFALLIMKQLYTADAIVELLGAHDQIAGGGLEVFHGKHRPDEECEDAVDGKCNCRIMSGPGAAEFATSWFDQDCNTFILLGAIEKMNPVPVLSYRMEGPWTIALLSGVIYT